ncbi:MAG: hypothetical protein RLY97_1646, partial [Pseudomonadota bacterium]
MAIVGGRPMPAAGTLRDAIVRSDANRKKMTLIPDDVGRTRGKHVVTHYRTVKLLDSAALVECRLETGRTHQVRVHMASIGHALLGDQTYGKTPKPLRALLDELGFARQALHAAVLGFIHPVSGESLRFTSEMPEDMRALLDALSDG